MSRWSLRVAGALCVASCSFAGPSAMADDVAELQTTSATVSISAVTWSVGAGGVGVFHVVVTNSGPKKLPAGVVGIQASSPPASRGATIGTLASGASATVDVGPTANGRCYDLVLVLEPDSGGLGIKVSPKTWRACLDPDGAGIVTK